MNRPVIAAYLAGSLLAAASSYSQKPPSGSSKPLSAYPQIERITDHVFRVGKAVVDTQAQSVTCTGLVNMSDGAIEYLAVAPGGKLHESLLQLDVRPLHLKLALLMLNLEPTNILKYQGDSATPQGDKVRLEVRWRNARGEQISVRAEDLIAESGSPALSQRHSWSFTGSRILKDVGFEADAEKSLIAVWHDPAAIIDNPARDGAANQHCVGAKCPHRNTPVELVITAEPAVKTDGKAR